MGGKIDQDELSGGGNMPGEHVQG